jgi:hypothetical protein
VENIKVWAAGSPTNVMNEPSLANMRRP